jgi:nitrate reductase gamma subunit
MHTNLMWIVQQGLQELGWTGLNLQWPGQIPLAWWWGLLTLVSTANIAVWFLLYRQLQEQPTGTLGSTFSIELMLLLCAAYVFGCAFRSFLPRADVQRICLFDTWLSSVVVGRSVATVAEICFAAQWAIILHQLATMTGADTTLNAAWVIVPLILIAECFSCCRTA